MQPEYTRMKVHNEIELCETTDMDAKQAVERVLLRNRISYYIKWYKQGILWRKRNVCVFCINDSFKDEAEQLIRTMDKDLKSKVEFLMRKSGESYF